MAFILNIDTSGEIGFVALSNGEEVLISEINPIQQTHANFLHTTIQSILKKYNISVNNLSAISVVNGPGSYTGLRVGLTAAKGLCYALDKPLITLNTLEVMATACIKRENSEYNNLYYCPMIDARRMEVFTAIYTNTLKEIISPCAMIIEENSFLPILENNKIIFCGNGSIKAINLIKHDNANFVDSTYTANEVIALTYTKFLHKKFTELTYALPNYLKEFYTNAQKTTIH